MNIVLWVIGGVVAAGFLASGATKLLQPKEKLVASSVGAALEGFNPSAIKAIGTLEILAAVGLILPIRPAVPYRLNIEHNSRRGRYRPWNPCTPRGQPRRPGMGRRRAVRHPHPFW